MSNSKAKQSKGVCEKEKKIEPEQKQKIFGILPLLLCRDNFCIMILAFVCSKCGGFFIIIRKLAVPIRLFLRHRRMSNGVNHSLYSFFAKFFFLYFFFARGLAIFFFLFFLFRFVWPEIAKRWEWMSPPGQHLPKILHGSPTDECIWPKIIRSLAGFRQDLPSAEARLVCDNPRRIAPSNPFAGSWVFFVLSFFCVPRVLNYNERTFSYGLFYKLWTSQWLLRYCYSFSYGLMRYETKSPD